MNPKELEILSIIIPARHEAANITKTIRAIEAYVRVPHQIIVVNNPTDTLDDTNIIVKALRATNRNIHLVELPNARGFAHAIATGIQSAGNNGPVLFVMADLCDDITTIDAMMARYREGYDVVCGSRYMPGGKKIGGPILQGLFSTLFNTVLTRITHFPTKDITNSFKLYRGALLRSLPIRKTDGFDVSATLILDAHKKGARITEVPTTWYGRIHGDSKFHFHEQGKKYLSLFWGAIKHKRTYSKK